MFGRKKQPPAGLEGVFLGKYGAAALEALTRTIDPARDGPIVAIGNMTLQPRGGYQPDYIFGVTSRGIALVSIGYLGVEKPSKDSGWFLSYDVVTAFAYHNPEDEEGNGEYLEFTLMDSVAVRMYPHFPRSRQIFREIAVAFSARE